jgi:hypothetical protein
MHPRLFTSLALIEAGIDPEYGKGIIFQWAKQRLRRVDSWSDRRDAEEALVKGPTFENWDPRVTSRLMEHGVYLGRDGASTQWRLSTPKHQEVALVMRLNSVNGGRVPDRMNDVTLHMREYVPDIDPHAWNPSPIYRPETKGMWDLLPCLRPWVLYVNGDSSPFFGGAKAREARARLTGTGVGGSGGMKLGTVQQVIIEGGRHTMTFDGNIRTIACHVAEWMSKEMTRWRTGENQRRAEWQAKSLQEKQRLPKELEAALEKVASPKSKL